MNIIAKIKNFFYSSTPRWQENVINEIKYYPQASFFGQINCSRIKLGTRDFLQSDLKKLFYKLDKDYHDHYVLLATYHMFILVGRGSSIIRYQIPIGLVEKSKLSNIKKQIQELDLDCEEII